MFDLFYNEPIISDITFGDVKTMATNMDALFANELDEFRRLSKTDLKARQEEFLRVQKVRLSRIDAASGCLSRFAHSSAPLPETDQVLMSLAIVHRIFSKTHRDDEMIKIMRNSVGL